jgi:MFS family permease
MTTIPTPRIETEVDPSDGSISRRRAWAAFGVLFAMHLLDFTDRNVLSAVLPPLRAPAEQGGLGIPIGLAGWLATIYLLSHSLFAPLMGWAGDRWCRTWLLGLGVGVWSLATVGSGLARNFGQIALSRSLLGIGEATYGVIAPTLLVDLFPRSMRTRVLSLFYLAMPLGSALGFVLGGSIASQLGWRPAFFVVGVPGLAMALLALTLPEPVRGLAEGVRTERLLAHEHAGAGLSDYLHLLRTPSYVFSVLGMASYTFAIGGLVFWMPDFLHSTRGIPLDRATLVLGAITVPAAILGMLTGGWVCDRLGHRFPRALFVVPGLTMLAAVPFVLLGLLSKSPAAIYAGIFFAELLMFVNTAPCNTIIANVTDPNLRARANATALAGVHLLGDLWSPPMIGAVAALFGSASMMATPIGRLLAALGAHPTLAESGRPENLAAGLLLVAPAILLSGLVFLLGARVLPDDTARMIERLAAPADRSGAATSKTPSQRHNGV